MTMADCHPQQGIPKKNYSVLWQFQQSWKREEHIGIRTIFWDLCLPFTKCFKIYFKCFKIYFKIYCKKVCVGSPLCLLLSIFFVGLNKKNSRNSNSITDVEFRAFEQL